MCNSRNYNQIYSSKVNTHFLQEWVGNALQRDDKEKNLGVNRRTYFFDHGNSYLSL